jgi:hypothetical protein
VFPIQNTRLPEFDKEQRFITAAMERVRQEATLAKSATTQHETVL